MDIWYLYRITNQVNGKCYIGLAHNPSARWRKHRSGHGSKLLKAATVKYGIKSFEFKMLCAGSKEYIQQLEIMAIKTFGTIAPNGYNLSTGGESGANGVKMSRESVYAVLQRGEVSGTGKKLVGEYHKRIAVRNLHANIGISYQRHIKENQCL